MKQKEDVDDCNISTCLLNYFKFYYGTAHSSPRVIMLYILETIID